MQIRWSKVVTENKMAKGWLGSCRERERDSICRGGDTGIGRRWCD